MLNLSFEKLWYLIKHYAEENELPLGVVFSLFESIKENLEEFKLLTMPYEYKNFQFLSHL